MCLGWPNQKICILAETLSRQNSIGGLVQYYNKILKPTKHSGMQAKLCQKLSYESPACDNFYVCSNCLLVARIRVANTSFVWYFLPTLLLPSQRLYWLQHFLLYVLGHKLYYPKLVAYYCDPRHLSQRPHLHNSAVHPYQRHGHVGDIFLAG